MARAIAAGLVICFCAADAPVGAADRPNVVIVMTDDQGLGDFSFTGNPILRTPHMDAIARESVRLADFHCAPMCSPTRGQLLTGLAALRNGATSVTAGRTFLRPGLPTLPELFAKAGYTTGLFGKWHLGDVHPHRPIDKGFGTSVHHLGWGQLQSTPEYGWPLIDGRLFRDGAEERYAGHCTDVWFDEAMAWMKRQKEAGTPFLCYIPTNAPHGPHIDLERFIEPYRQSGGPAAFYGMIAHVDARLGDLDAFLAKEGLRDDTILIFTTDNGGTAGVKTFNAGLRAGKTTYYDGGHRVPCWIRWPDGGLGEPRDIDVPTQNTDLLPTLCELCGVEPPERSGADLPYAGTSLARLLRGAADAVPERTLVVQYGQTPKKHDACVIRGPWRLVHGTELYDIVADRGQATDLAAKHPEMVGRLRADYDTWWAGVEPLVDAFVPQSIGSAAQPAVEFTSGDWENIYADNAGLVRSAVGGPTGGRWHVRVERPGRYRFTLRRWPARSDSPLGGPDLLAAGEDTATPVTNGAAGRKKPAERKMATFPGIAEAHLKIGDAAARVPADPAAKAATIETTLPTGTTTMQAWFADSAGAPLCGAFFVTAEFLGDAAASPRPANVIVILADDAGFGDFSCHGNTNLRTPHVDSLARDGAAFEQFMVQPVCAPTRAELLTGRYHPRSGVRGVSLGQERMAADERTVANVFRDAGHATGCFGKWHNGTQWPFHPLARGFETFRGFTEGHWNDYFDPPLEHDGRFVRGTGFIADDVTTNAIAFMDRSHAAGRPFFCHLAFNTPHSPMCVPDAEWERFRDRALALRGPAEAAENVPLTRAALAMVENIDSNVGRVLAAIDRLGVADDTIVVFFSDNGPNSPRWCAGLKGIKGSTDDGGVRSVCHVRFPRAIRPGAVVREVAGAIDLLPTLAGLAGVPAAAAKPLDGSDLSPLLTGMSDMKTSLAGRAIVSSFGGRVSVRTTHHRLDHEGRLYDMRVDPGQTRDIAAEQHDVAARLARVATDYRRDVLDAVGRPAEERFTVGFPAAPMTELPARDGRPHGGVTRSSRAPNASYFTTWTRPDDSITWTVDVLASGTYSAEVWYTCPEADAGSTIELSCGHEAVSAEVRPGWDPPPNRGDDRVERKAEGYDKDFHPLRLGTIRLEAGPATLLLKATNIPGRTVADIRRLVLHPVAP